MAKNEIDIIETFIRYHLLILDGMVILDNGSTDGTKEVILRLIEEGLPVYLIFDDSPAYNQSEMTTDMLYHTIKRFSPEFVLPLDVDEFLTTYSGKNIRDILNKEVVENAINYISWVTYAPTERDDMLEINILKRIRHRRLEQNNYDEKILIPASIPSKYKIKIKHGNHDLEKIDGLDFKKNKLSNLNLAHFPVRSINQIKSKYIVGWLSQLARPRQVIFDWYYYYNIIKSGKELTSNDLKKMALYYDVINKNQKIELIEDPLDLSLIDNFQLKYTSLENINYLNNVLNYVEILARKYSETVKRVNPKNEIISQNDQAVLQTIQDFMLIDGWLNVREACELYKIIKSLKGKKLILCEIGSWLGRSSYVLAKAIEDKKESCLYCIDPFDGTGDEPSRVLYKQKQDALSKSLIEEFNKNMAKLGVSDIIKVIQGYSFKVIKKFNKKIDLLFIDGNHDYKSVLNDYLQWSPLIKKGGYIAFHDVGASHTTGPKQVVEQEIVRNSIWGEQKLIDELYLARKVK